MTKYSYSCPLCNFTMEFDRPQKYKCEKCGFEGFWVGQRRRKVVVQTILSYLEDLQLDVIDGVVITLESIVEEVTQKWREGKK